MGLSELVPTAMRSSHGETFGEDWPQGRLAKPRSDRDGRPQSARRSAAAASGSLHRPPFLVRGPASWLSASARERLVPLPKPDDSGGYSLTFSDVFVLALRSRPPRFGFTATGAAAVPRGPAPPRMRPPRATQQLEAAGRMEACTPMIPSWS